jgi:hypothetical protein
MKNKTIIWIPQALVSVMLLVALNPENPYGYYVLLRWVVCGVFAFLALKAFEEEKTEWVWALRNHSSGLQPVHQDAPRKRTLVCRECCHDSDSCRIHFQTERKK